MNSAPLVEGDLNGSEHVREVQFFNRCSPPPKGVRKEPKKDFARENYLLSLRLQEEWIKHSSFRCVCLLDAIQKKEKTRTVVNDYQEHMNFAIKKY